MGARVASSFFPTYHLPTVTFTTPTHLLSPTARTPFPLPCPCMPAPAVCLPGQLCAYDVRDPVLSGAGR